jgi:dTMP kinase
MIGKFIVLEGCEGAGKTSICERLKKVFTDPNKVIFTREPGGTPFAEELRSIIFRNAGDPFLEICLFNAARRHHLVNLIMPNLRSGVSVICDRYVASTYAYQIVARNNPALQVLLRSLTHGAEVDPSTGRSFSPHYIFLDVPPEVGLERVKRRKGEFTPFDNEQIAFHNNVYQGFNSFMRVGMHKTNLVSWDVIDASRGQEEVYQDVLRKIEVLLIS